MTAARTQTRREGNKGWKNGLPNVKVGSHPSNPLRHSGVGSWKRWTKRVPIATLPVGAFREKRPLLPEGYAYFFRFLVVSLNCRDGVASLGDAVLPSPAWSRRRA